MEYKAIDTTPDRQRNQTMAVAHFIMQAIGKHIPDDGSSRKYAMYDLVEALDKAGVDIITAEHRANAGLLPRGPKGWTNHELQVLEAKRMEALLSPMPPFIVTTPRS
jgi:hypothetical protein